MEKPIKYAARLSHVREVSLVGAADLGFWKRRLRRESLAPIEHEGGARVMVVAAEARYMGLKFREVSISVLAFASPGGARQEGAYLLQAFNSSKLFTFFERKFFSTPYDHADVERAAGFPSRIEVLDDDDREVLFRVVMKADPPGARAREPLRQGVEGWEGPVFLPTPAPENEGKPQPPKLFFARLGGETRAYPFRRSEDLLTIKASSGIVALQSLLDSAFAPLEWIVREDAMHAKSKAQARSA